MHHRLLYHQMLVSPHVGGGARLAMEIHRHATSARGPVSELLLPRGGEAERAALKEGFPFTAYDVARLGSACPWLSWMENLRLRVRTVGHGCGVIHVHSPFVYGAARPFLLLTGFKRVLHVHLDFTVDQLKWALKLPPDLIVVCGDFMRLAVERALAEHRGRQSIVRVIRNGVDTERFFPTDRTDAKARLGADVGVPLLMVVANLALHKGQETAIRAAAILKAMGYQVKLWLVGTERNEASGYLRYLKGVCTDLGVNDRVDFVGFRNDIPDLLRAADFVLLPSTSEGLPLVILEAQASKALVLAAPTAGVPEVIEDRRTGVLVAADDYEGYAHQVASLLDHPAQRTVILETAYRHVRDHHDMKRYCERILREYDDLLLA